MSYVGPVVNTATGKVDPSPDALILDMRKSPYKIRRCEFKEAPSSSDAFKENGRFDLAVVWSIERPLTKEILEKELLEKHGCTEVVVLEEISAFHKLPEYTIENINRSFDFGSESIKETVLKNRSGIASVYVIYIAAKIYPERFDAEKMLDLLKLKVPKVAEMKNNGNQGSGNIIGTFTQTKPPFIKRMHGKSYQWNDDYDPVVAGSLLTEWIKINFRKEVPTDAEIFSVIDR
jgi:hypothetical protein